MRADGLVRELWLPPQPHWANFDRAVLLKWQSLRARMEGPGGLYNAGNAFGIATGLVFYIAAAPAAGSALGVTGTYFFGTVSAVAITIARVLFIISGELYYHAWKYGFPPNPRLTFLGDFLSGVAAIILGFGLFILGEPVLALASGFMQALGKFGNALDQDKSNARRQMLWRLIVFFSRFPAIALCTLALVRATPAALGGEWLPAAEAASFLVCYLIWLKADWLLVRVK
jgi:hypothetical protein